MDIYLQKAVTSIPFKYTVKPVLRGHQSKWSFKTGHMNISMTGQEKSDLLIQVTA